MGGLSDTDGNQVNIANPGLAPLNGHGGLTETVALLPDSPAIGTGTSDGLVKDERGEPFDSPPDIGAFQTDGFTLTVTPSTTTAVFGQTITFTGLLNANGGGTGRGEVTYSDNGTVFGTSTLVSGLTRLTDSSLPLGVNTITITYVGDPGLVNTVSVTITQADAEASLSPIALRNKRGKISKVELEVQMLPDSPGVGVPTGTVTFEEKGVTRSVPLSGGTATLTGKPANVLNKPIIIL